MSNMTTTNLTTFRAALAVASLHRDHVMASADAEAAFLGWHRAGRPSTFVAYVEAMREVALACTRAWTGAICV